MRFNLTYAIIGFIVVVVLFCFTSKMEVGSDYHTGTEYRAYTFFGIKTFELMRPDETALLISNEIGYRPQPKISYGSTYWFNGTCILCMRGDPGPNYEAISLCMEYYKRESLANRALIFEGFKMAVNAPVGNKNDIAVASLLKNSKMIPADYVDYLSDRAPNYKDWLDKVK